MIKLLVLDDNPDDLAQIRRLLRDTTEFTADYLSDARQAIAKIQSGCYDIIVLDLLVAEVQPDHL
ncbi:MAG: hypothetical protein ACPGUF_05305, partial [Litorivicinus sp.]